MIRPAINGDIPRLAEIMMDLHARSKFASRCTVNKGEVKRMFLGFIARNQSRGIGGTCVFVAERDGKVEGFMVGLLDQVYHIGSKLSANDVYFTVTQRADPRDASRLLSAYDAWASANPNVITINLSATDVIEPTKRVEKLFRRRGFIRCGAIYERSVR